MRIVAGKYKGNHLHLPSDKKTRPLKDLVKESIFNVLIHSNKILFKIENSIILDLYSGAGSFGLECLSRKGGKVFFVEREKDIIRTLKKNIEKLKLKGKTEIYIFDVLNFVRKKIANNTNFDLIFCDPPYKNTDLQKLIELIYFNKLIKKNGIFIFHRKKNSRDKIPDYLKILDYRVYGSSKIFFGKFLF